MSQTFNLSIASDAIASDAQQLGVSIDDLKRIHVSVIATIIRKTSVYLQLNYHVTLPNKALATLLDWSTWQPAQVEFSDYLWEETCLECFISGSTVEYEHSETQHTTSYVEVNANPDGRYAVYQFENYRNPATLPPTPMYQADGDTRASIEWTTELKQQNASVDTLLPNTLTTLSKPHNYERSFSILLTKLSSIKPQYAINNTVIEYIHPCVILWLNKTPLYFAVQHASPPDFHDRHYWSSFEL